MNEPNDDNFLMIPFSNNYFGSLLNDDIFSENNSSHIVIRNEVTSEKTNYFIVTSKKVGRKGKNEKKNNICHNKYSSDNILIKIQVHFLNFIVDFINIVLQHFKHKEHFYPLDYNFKKNVTKKARRDLKELNIGNILFKEKSQKYKKNKERNIDIYTKLKNCQHIKIIDNILSCKYLDFFKNYYCNADNNLSLKNFGSDDIINIYEKAEMFNDLKQKYISDPLYIEKLEKWIKNYENIK